jgi:hypothetical protein
MKLFGVLFIFIMTIGCKDAVKVPNTSDGLKQVAAFEYEANGHKTLYLYQNNIYKRVYPNGDSELGTWVVSDSEESVINTKYFLPDGSILAWSKYKIVEGKFTEINSVIK